MTSIKCPIKKQKLKKKKPIRYKESLKTIIIPMYKPIRYVLSIIFLVEIYHYVFPEIMKIN